MWWTRGAGADERRRDGLEERMRVQRARTKESRKDGDAHGAWRERMGGRGRWLESRERRRRKLSVGKQRDRATVSTLSGELGQREKISTTSRVSIERPSFEQLGNLPVFVQPLWERVLCHLASFHLNQIVRERDQGAVAVPVLS